MDKNPEAVLSPQRWRFRGLDPSRIRETLKGASLDHCQLGEGKLDCSVLHMPLKDAFLSSTYYSLAMTSQGMFPENLVGVGFALGGDGDCRVLGQTSQPGDLLLFSPGCELDAVMPPNMRWACVGFSLDDFNRIFRLETPLTGRALNAGVHVFKLRHNVSEKLFRFFSELLQWLWDEDKPTLTRQQERAFSQDLIDYLSEAMHSVGDYSLTHDTLRMENRHRVVATFVDYMMSRAGEPVYMEDLSREFNVSRRTVELLFREVFDESPACYLRKRRLNGVRNTLLNREDSRSVTEIACDWGFWHLGRFSRFYKNLFDECPSETRSRT